jgi:hypothetical protein
MFTVERRTGRLVEARVFRLMTPEDVAQYRRAFTPKHLTGRPTLLADHRPVAIYPKAVAAKLIDLFSDLNGTWERVAIVIAETNATMSLQLERIVRESQNPSRRVFIDPAEALRFLGETLESMEMARAAVFLAEAPPLSSRGRAS